MLTQYFRIALRHLWHHRLYFLISVAGLAAGIAALVLIALLVHHELTYDRFHANADQIVLITRSDPQERGGESDARTPDPLAETLRNDYPGLANVVRFVGQEFPVSGNGKKFTERFFYVSPSLFQSFTFPLERGNPGTVFANVNDVVLTRETARKFFGDADPIGKTLTLLGRHEFTVSGVLSPLPENSSIKFDMLAPERLLRQIMPEFGRYWHSSGSYTFVQCSDRMSARELADQLPFIVKKHVPDWLKGRVALGMIPLTRIHLSPTLPMDLEPTTSPEMLLLLIGLALAILMIACINSMNLSTARYSERAKEIGVRKAAGASRGQLIRQFLSESVITSLSALVLGVALAELLLPEFNLLAGKNLSLIQAANLVTVVGLLGFGLVVGIVSGSYPAFFLSSRGALDVLKGARPARPGGIHWRRTFVFVQFAISSALIVCVIILTEQLRYMRNHALGFDSTEILAVATNPDDLAEPESQIAAYQNDIHTHEAEVGIISAALSEHIPGDYYNNTFGVIPEGAKGRDPLIMNVTSVDENFLPTYGITLAAGRNFSAAFGTDRSDAILMNETAVQRIGWKDPLGKKITYTFGEGPYTVVGVVKDIHFKSMQFPIEPQIYRYAWQGQRMKFLSVRIRPHNEAQAISFLADAWARVAKGIPFDYFFVSDKYASSYHREEKQQEIIGIASLLAVLLACLGLSGLIALAVAQRTKELGVRKVLGATIPDILLLLIKRFLVLVLAANLLGWPLAYLFMHRWLENYPYRMEMGPVVFLVGGMFMLVMALLSVGTQAIKAALANPVKSLRYE